MKILLKSFLLLVGMSAFGVLDFKLTSAEFLEAVCLQPVDEGQQCNEAKPEPQYGFSQELEQCVPFQYNGCGGNKNRFKVQDDCTDACQIDWYKKKNKKEGPLFVDITNRSPSDCMEPKDVGPCRAMLPYWYFDSTAGTCQTFIYGGCMGTQNRFGTEAQCQHVCIKKSK